MTATNGGDGDAPQAPEAIDTSDFTLPKKVFEAEVGEIRKRRAVRDIPLGSIDPKDGLPLDEPSPEHELVGMCLSGGGIRSATFGLGVIQALARKGLFEHVDYLSTVSGGGFTGSMLSAVLNDPRQTKEPFPVRKETGESEPPALHHLRDASRYLSSGSLLESLRLPMVIIRGIILSLLIVLPTIMIAVFLTELAYEGGLWPDYAVLSGRTHLNVFPIIGSLFVLAICLVPFLRSVPGYGMRWNGRDRLELSLSFGLGLVLLSLVAEPLVDLISAAIEITATNWSPGKALADRFDPRNTPVQRSVLLVLGVVVGLFGLVWLFRKLPTSVLLGLAGLLGPAMLFGLYMGLCLVQIDSPFLVSSLQADLEEVADATRRGTLHDDVHAEADCPSEEALASEHPPDNPPNCAARQAHERLEHAVLDKNPGLSLEPGELIQVVRTAPYIEGEDGQLRCDPEAPLEWLVIAPELAERWPGGQAGLQALASEHACLPIVGADKGHTPQDDVNRFFGTGDSQAEASCAWPEVEGQGQALPLPLSADALDPCLGSFRVHQRQVLTNQELLLEMDGARLGLWGEPSSQTMIGDLAFLLIAAGTTLYVLFFYDVNVASLHGFYRDRLSKAYLFQEKEPGKQGDDHERLVHCDELRLSELNTEIKKETDPAKKYSPAPYHLINVVLNITSGDEGSLRGRKSDFFIFSKHFCGGPRTGYQPTKRLEKIDSHLNLGTAMAISGAAAAPNMGALTPGTLAFVMTLLNFRMGYWLPNPAEIHRLDQKKAPADAFAPPKAPVGWFRPGPFYLVREALGSLSTQKPLINVSDGGHLENLGIYELLRRRCKLIIAVDGERDPDMNFVGLVSLMRYAEIDLGVHIEIDLEPFEYDEGELDVTNLDGETYERLRRENLGKRRSKAHWVIGRIEYGEDEHGDEQTGTLIYVKSSLTEDISPVLARYQRYNPDFPHESTADQFFSEEQFEAYRALGDAIGQTLLDNEDGRGRLEVREGRLAFHAPADPGEGAAAPAEA